MGVRLYNPVTARFLSRDPLYGGNDNSYVYPVDPVQVFDLTGEHCDVYFGECTYGSRQWVSSRIVARSEWKVLIASIGPRFYKPKVGWVRPYTRFRMTRRHTTYRYALYDYSGNKDGYYYSVREIVSTQTKDCWGTANPDWEYCTSPATVGRSSRQINGWFVWF